MSGYLDSIPGVPFRKTATVPVEWLRIIRQIKQHVTTTQQQTEDSMNISRDVMYCSIGRSFDVSDPSCLSLNNSKP